MQEFFIVQPSKNQVMCYDTENVFVNDSFQRKLFFKRVCNNFLVIQLIMSFNNTSFRMFEANEDVFGVNKKGGYSGKLRLNSLFISLFISKYICTVRTALCLTGRFILQPSFLPCPICAAWRSGPCWGVSACARSA